MNTERRRRLLRERRRVPGNSAGAIKVLSVPHMECYNLTADEYCDFNRQQPVRAWNLP